MALGVVIRNKNDIVQVDGYYKNYALVAKGTVNCNLLYDANGIGGAYYSATITVPSGSFPLVGIRCASKCFVLNIVPGPSNTCRITFIAQFSNTLVTYYVFSDPITDPSGVGFKIRNRVTGETVFNSLWNIMRVLDYVQVDMTTALSFNWSGTYASREIAIVQAGRTLTIGNRVYENPPGSGVFVFEYQYSTGFMNNSSASSVTLQYAGLSLQGPFRVPKDPELYTSSLNYLIIDVTGY